MSGHGVGGIEYYKGFVTGLFKRNPQKQRELAIERMYQRLLLELAANRFKWTGLPDEIDPRFLEMTLAYNGLSLFYFDKTYNAFMAPRATPSGWYNVYDNPTAFTTYGNRFIGKRILAQDAVPIWANYTRTPDLDVIGIYASKFANFDRTIEINSANARQPKIAAISENTKLSSVNFNRQVDEGNSFIQVVGDTNLGSLADMITAFDLGINPDTIEKLHIVRTRLWSECMGLLGIDNANQDKKERLVEGETEANNAQTLMMRHVNLNARRQAAEQINKKYGLNVGVAYHTDVDKVNEMVLGKLLGGGTDTSNDTEEVNA
jgi:hypothetical protein